MSNQERRLNILEALIKVKYHLSSPRHTPLPGAVCLQGNSIPSRENENANSISILRRLGGEMHHAYQLLNRAPDIAVISEQQGAPLPTCKRMFAQTPSGACQCPRVQSPKCGSSPFAHQRGGRK